MYSIIYKNVLHSVLGFCCLAVCCLAMDGCGNSPYDRMLKYGDSDIYDYNIFPYRQLTPSDSLVPILKDTTKINEKFRKLIDKKQLPGLLKNNRTLSFFSYSR